MPRTPSVPRPASTFCLGTMDESKVQLVGVYRMQPKYLRQRDTGSHGVPFSCQVPGWTSRSRCCPQSFEVGLRHPGVCRVALLLSSFQRSSRVTGQSGWCFVAVHTRPVTDGVTNPFPALLGGVVPGELGLRFLRCGSAHPRNAERRQLIDGETMTPPARNQPVPGRRILLLESVDPRGEYHELSQLLVPWRPRSGRQACRGVIRIGLRTGWLLAFVPLGDHIGLDPFEPISQWTRFRRRLLIVHGVLLQ